MAILATAQLLGPVAGAEWLQWGGPERDFAIEARAEIPPWPDTGPPLLWRRDLGPGYSAVVVTGGRLITMLRRDESEVVVALSLANGETLWEHAYPAPAKPDPSSLDTSYGAGPNSTPLIVGENVYTLGFTGMLNCLRTEDGARVWGRDLSAAGVRIPYFGHASSPIRHGDTVIVVGGGAHAFDLASGTPRWSNTSFEGSYASPVLVGSDENPVLQIAGAGLVVGLSPGTGDLLWRHDLANDHKTILSSPVVAGDDWVFVSAYFVGSVGLQLEQDGRTATRRWENSRLQLSNSNAVRDGDWIYASNDSILTSIEVRTGKLGWRHRGIRRANLLKFGSQFLLLDQLGRLVLASLTPEGITVHAESQVYEGRAWTVPTLYERTLFVRTEDSLLALDLSGRGTTLTHSSTVSAAMPTPLAGFLEAKRQLSNAIYAGDAVALEAARTAFGRWTSTEHAAHLAHYYSGIAAARQALLGGPQALSLLDTAVDHLETAQKLKRGFADAHAALSRLYSMYYRLDRRRASVIGPKGDEHLQLALIQAPDNPRVLAAHGADLVNSPVEYGGDRSAGLDAFRRALAVFENAPLENTSTEPDGGHALAWYDYGQALLSGPAPDRDGARAAFREAQRIQPRFADARRQLEALGPDQD